MASTKKDTHITNLAALEIDPENVTYATGAIYTLSDMGRGREALDMAKELHQKIMAAAPSKE